jgi:cytochrome c peroxidase
MKKVILLSGISAILMLTVACNEKPDFDYYYYEPAEYALISESLNLPELPHNYQVDFPEHLSRTGIFPRSVSSDRAVLGRVLFYDKSLSKDGTISCASCHKQELGFADNATFSQGVFDRQTDRNSFALSSVANFSAYYGTDLNGAAAIRFFWDNRAATVADQATGSLTNPKEMNMDMDEVALAVQNQAFYKPLFRKAYGDEAITVERITGAISDFVNAMGSINSRFDQEANKKVAATQAWGDMEPVIIQDFTGFSASENNGKKLYLQNCSSCHSVNQGRPPKFFANNGIDEATVDAGVGGISGTPSEMGTFKVPTLRNIALTAPYMHDGRFQTLEEVVEHYSSGIKNHPNLSSELKTGTNQVRQMNFTASEKADLIAFLNTLTDQEFAIDERFSNPFK